MIEECLSEIFLKNKTRPIRTGFGFIGYDLSRKFLAILKLQ